jgi:hypothetical protein
MRRLKMRGLKKLQTLYQKKKVETLKQKEDEVNIIIVPLTHQPHTSSSSGIAFETKSQSSGPSTLHSAITPRVALTCSLIQWLLLLLAPPLRWLDDDAESLLDSDSTAPNATGLARENEKRKR